MYYEIINYCWERCCCSCCIDCCCLHLL